MKSSPAMTLQVFAAYLTVLGAVLLLVPNLLLSIFGMPETSEVWIRVIGMLIVFIAIYYFQIVRENNLRLIQTTVYVRASVIVFFVVFVALGYVQATLLLFGVIDLLGALWTWYAMRNVPLRQTA